MVRWNIGYGRHELAEAAYEQMKELPLLQFLLYRCTTPTPVAAGRAPGADRARQHEPGVFRPRRDRRPMTRALPGSCAIIGRWRQSRRRTASSRASGPINGSTIAGTSLGGMPAYAQPALRGGAQYRSCHGRPMLSNWRSPAGAMHDFGLRAARAAEGGRILAAGAG